MLVSTPGRLVQILFFPDVGVLGARWVRDLSVSISSRLPLFASVCFFVSLRLRLCILSSFADHLRCPLFPLTFETLPVSRKCRFRSPAVSSSLRFRVRRSILSSFPYLSSSLRVIGAALGDALGPLASPRSPQSAPPRSQPFLRGSHLHLHLNQRNHHHDHHHYLWRPLRICSPILRGGVQLFRESSKVF